MEYLNFSFPYKLVIMNFIPYESRKRAGKLLAEFISIREKELYKLIQKIREEFFLFTIPNGGVPVAEGFCQIMTP